MNVTLISKYRNDDFFQEKNAPVYVYQGGGSPGGGSVDLSNYYTKAESASIFAPINNPALTGNGSITGSFTATGGVIQSNVGINIAPGAGAGARIDTFSAGGLRWSFGKASYAETGSDAGSDFAIYRYSDAGVYLGQPFYIWRKTGKTEFNSSVPGDIGVYIKNAASDGYGIYCEVQQTGRYCFAASAAGTQNAWIYGGGNIVTNGEIQTDKQINRSGSFVSGFSGSGYRINNSGGKYELEVDSLIVRGGLFAYSLEINKINATNGSLWVTDSAKVKTATSLGGSNYRVTVDNEGGSISLSLANNDIIRCQIFTGSGVKYYSGAISSLSGNQFDIAIQDGAGTPSPGDVLVRVGNSSTSSRRGSIYLTASDTDAPFIDILDEVSGYSWGASNRKARIGNLSGITFDGSALSGYGFYSKNAYLEENVRILGVVEFGTQTANYGGINAAVAIKNSDIWENAYNGDFSPLWINRIGYNGGVTKSRILYIGDGKGNQIAAFSGGGIDLDVYLYADEGLSVYKNMLHYDGSYYFQGTTWKVGGSGGAEFTTTTNFNNTATFNRNIRSAAATSGYDLQMRLPSSFESGFAFNTVTFSSGTYNASLTAASIIVGENNSYTKTVNLPSSPGNGQMFICINRGSGTFTISGNGKNCSVNGSLVTSFTIGQRRGITVVYDSLQWQSVGYW